MLKRVSPPAAIAGTFAIILAAALTAQSARADLPYRGAQGFTVKFPSGWVQIPDSAMKQLTGLVGSVQYDAAFQLGGSSQQWFTYPYALVYVQSLPRTPGVSEMREQLTKLTGLDLQKAKKSLTEAGERLYIASESGELKFDDVAKSFVWTVRMQVKGVGWVKGIVYGRFGERCLVTVNCYARDNEFRDHLPTFNQISKTFSFEPGREWTEEATRRSGFDWGRIGVKALIGGILGALGAVGMKMRRKISGGKGGS